MGFPAFFTSTGGIILLSILGIVLFFGVKKMREERA